MRILVCGDRNWTDRKAIEKALEEAMMETPLGRVTIIEGGATGADTLAGEIAMEWKINLEVYHAEWEKYGRAAGPRRNAEMLKAEPDVVLAFHHDLRQSKGTANMVKQAAKAGIPVTVIS